MTAPDADPWRRSDGFEPIAVVSMAGRFPGAPDVERFRANLVGGHEAITRRSAAAHVAAGGDPRWAAEPGFVGAEGELGSISGFDAEFFGYSPREAGLMDPQHRLLLESAWVLFDTVGYDPAAVGAPVGVFVATAPSSYLVRNLLPAAELVDVTGGLPLLIHNDKDFAASTLSYKLGLTGPSYAVGSACSASLAATHLACQSLRAYESDMAVAGGAAVLVPHGRGYVHRPDGVYSARGRCAPYAADGDGTVGSSGVALVLLKRLSDALRDADVVHGLLLGSAANNDGSGKVGYTAPSVAGQRRVIEEAQAVAGVRADTIGYVEGHGTGTALGDPIEVEALTAAFRRGTDRCGFCALGSVKGSVGHLDAAAGTAGLIAALLAVRDGMIPASLHCAVPHPAVDAATTPFYVPTTTRPWVEGAGPRRAGVSSFGIGGTNVHMVVEQPPQPPARPASSDPQNLTVTAATGDALATAVAELAAHLERLPDLAVTDVAATLDGRRRFSHRVDVAAVDALSAAAALRAAPLREPVGRSSVSARPGSALVAGRRVELPPHPFRRRRHWIDPPPRPVPALSVFADHLRAAADPAAVTSLDDITGLRSGLDEMGAALVVEYLAGCGVDVSPGARHSVAEIHGELAVLPEFVRFVDWQLGVLEADGVLERAAETVRFGAGPRPRPSDQVLAEVIARHPRHAGMAHLLAHCGSGLRRALSVPGAAVDTLYPGGDPELLRRTLVQDTAPLGSIDALCAAVAQLIRQLAAGPARPVRILEIGAGSGRLTQVLVTAAPGRTACTITDISPALVARLARQARETGVENLRTGVLDAGRDPRRQGYPPGGFDLVCGLDVVHATPDVARTVSHLRTLLAPGGVLALVETIRNDRWTSLVWGLAADWWNATDGRTAGPLLPVARWRELLERGGVDETAVVTVGSGADAALVLGRAPADVIEVDTPTGATKRSDPASWGYVARWQQAQAPPAAPPVATPTGCLVFADGPLGGAVATLLRERGVAPVLVRRRGVAPGPVPGAPIGVPELTVDLGDERIDPTGRLRAQPRVRLAVHLWAAEDAARRKGPAGAEEVDAAQALGLHSLLALARAFGADADRDPVRVAVVTAGSQDVLGDDLTCPEHATLHAAVKILPREYPWLSCVGVDLPRLGAEPAGTARRVVNELLAARPGSATTVAFRGRRRFVPHYTPARLGPAGSGAPPAGGTYLILGGLGGIGLSIAEYLAALPAARLVLTHRRALPADPNVLRRVRALRERGTDVIVLRAELADPGDVRAAVAAAEGDDGRPITGVVHAAGIPDVAGIIQWRDRAQTEEVIAAKVRGTLNLHEALGDRTPDFVVLCSSIATVLPNIKFGEVGYLAGNEFLDAFAAARSATHPGRTVSVGWTDWLDTGMYAAAQEQLRDRYVVDPLRPDPSRPDADLLGGITRAEGTDVLARILAGDPDPHVIVSTLHLPDLLARHAAFGRSDHLTAIELRATPTPATPRPARSGAPALANPTESVLAGWWSELLGYPQVAPDENFFEIGGDSLVALRVLALIEDRFGVVVSLDALSDRPTVAELASFVDAHRRTAGGPAEDPGAGADAVDEVVL